MLETIDLKWICQGNEPPEYKNSYAETMANYTNKKLEMHGYYAIAEMFGKKVFYCLYGQFDNPVAIVSYKDDAKEWTVNLDKGPEISYNDLWAVNCIMEAIAAMGGTDKEWTYPDSPLAN